jgi:hypothetical protein
MFEMRRNARELRDMTSITGNLSKMPVEPGPPAQYTFALSDARVPMNPLMGTAISLEYTGNIHCVECGRKTKKSFSQGHCYPCMQRLASCDSCIVKPELCHYHKGTCRQPEWGEANCMSPHIVYLANSSGLKVGVTRKTQVPTRWLDQGATQALPIFEVPTRRIAGLVEVALAKHVADKTDWRKMLRGSADPLVLDEKAQALLAEAGGVLDDIDLEDGQTIERLPGEGADWAFDFPVEQHPEKVKSMTLDKIPKVEGVLQGIKGQYLILDTGVINIRRHGGYEVVFTYD